MRLLCLILAGLCLQTEPLWAQQPIAHWKLAGNARDSGPSQWHGTLVGDVGFNTSEGEAAAVFNGRNAVIEVPLDGKLNFGKSDFTISAQVKLNERGDDLPGDILSLYDREQRCGLMLSIKTNSGTTSSQANTRQLQFGIDQAHESEWTDCGRPGGERSILAFSLAVHQGQLFAGTCEPQPIHAGRVYRYGGGQNWIDCGAPDRCNSVSAMASYQGHLYVGVAKYRTAGSALLESENPNLGGHIYQYAGGEKWIDCGALPGSPAIGGLVVYQGQLYASSLYAPAGFYRYDGGLDWTDCGVPNGKRVESMTIFNGDLYASSYDGGNVYRFDGHTWTDLGVVGANTQCYGFTVHYGQLYVSTWPSGRVFRFGGPKNWIDTGRLGEELEVMGLVVHNGRLLGGTLPLAEVHQYNGDGQWQKLRQLDQTPDVKYRRAWTVAEYQGRTYWSTLPSGRVWSYGVGCSVTSNREFPSGWTDVKAVRRGRQLELWVNNELQSQTTCPIDMDLSVRSPLRIGAGPNDYFYGQIRDLKCYDQAIRPVN